ncbi:unnamed protein product [Symbiodinium sp. CCMP2456]|nr:unnamed protein product [Symbiodinium sp. CCMP2456]
MVPYWFAALTMKSVGKAAGEMVAEVKRHLRGRVLRSPHSYSSLEPKSDTPQP